MFRINPAHFKRVALTATVLGCGLQVTSRLATVSWAAAVSPVTSHPGGAVSRAMIGEVRRATGHTLVMVQLGSKVVRHIRLTTRTEYIVQGKRVTREPSWTMGLHVRVTTTKVKGSYTAHIVTVAPITSFATTTGNASSSSSSNAALSATQTISGVVTLTSSASVTLQNSVSTTTIKLTPSTRYAVKGKVTASKPMFHAGEKVRVTVVHVKGVSVGQLLTVN